MTLGLRIDVPFFMTDLQSNDKVAAETYRDGIKIDVSKYPNAKPQFSPRFGFNYKPFDDENGSLQIRGGTGLFTGTLLMYGSVIKPATMAFCLVT